MLNFPLSPKGVTYTLLGVFALLLAAHGLGLVMHYGFGHGRVFGLVPLFNMGNEHSVPTLFATLLLLASGFLFFVLFRAEDSSAYLRRVWLLLSLVFCFLAVDEYAVLHERLIGPVREGLGVGGVLHFAWVIPYAVGVAALAVFVLPAIWRLGWRYRLLFGASGVAYLGGAIGVEMLGGNYYQANNEQADLTYRLYQTVEETLEFLGVIILIHTLMTLLQSRVDSLTFQLAKAT